MRQRIAPAFGLAILFGTAASAADAPGCKPAPIGTAQVRAVTDGRTLQLADGREVRLLGVEVPESAKTALESLASGREIALWRLGSETDRYGRMVALASMLPEPPENSLQKALLERGQARVSAQTGDSGCAAVLLRAERHARAAGLGLWADPYYVIRNAEDPAGTSRFGVVSPWLRAKFYRSAKAEG